MKNLVTIAIAIMVLVLAGVASAGEAKTTKRGWPACLAEGGPKTFINFVRALVEQDEFILYFYTTEKGCAPMKGDMRAEILSGDENIVKVRLYPEGHPPADVWTVPGALK
jgi:hypothetical protein